MTCSTTRLITLGFGAGVLVTAFRTGALRFAAVFAAPFFPAAERRADVALALLAAGRFEVFLDALEDFFAPPFLAAEALLDDAFFEAFFEVFFEDGRALREAFLEDFRDEPFFDALFFEAFFDDLREELFLDAMLCLLLKLSVQCRTGSGDHAAWQLGCTKSI